MAVCLFVKQEQHLANVIPQKVYIHCFQVFYAICVLTILPTPTFWIRKFQNLPNSLLPWIICSKILRAFGVGAELKHTEGISINEEDSLWKLYPLRTLACSVFFYNEKCFCLRGGQEHRNLQLSQLKRLYCPDQYVYYENASKNRKGCRSCKWNTSLFHHMQIQMQESVVMYFC